jgi:hypothetical protein
MATTAIMSQRQPKTQKMHINTRRPQQEKATHLYPRPLNKWLPAALIRNIRSLQEPEPYSIPTVWAEGRCWRCSRKRLAVVRHIQQRDVLQRWSRQRVASEQDKDTLRSYRVGLSIRALHIRRSNRHCCTLRSIAIAPGIWR